MALTIEEIGDAVIASTRDLGRLRFTQIAQDLQNYPVMREWLQKERVTFDGGTAIQRNVMTDLGDAAEHHGLFAQDVVNVTDHMTTANVPWRHLTETWAVEHFEGLANRGRQLVFKVIKPRRSAALIRMAGSLESKAWAVPATDNDVDPFGIPYWFVYNATTGFNGGNPGSHTATGGINRDTVSAWKNYTAQYTNVTKADLIKALRLAHLKTQWISPVTIQDYRSRTGQRFRLYCNSDTRLDIETLGENQNENLGRDIASMDGEVVFRNHPIRWIPQIDDGLAGDPIYMIDHNTFHVYVMEGDYMRETTVAPAPLQHNSVHNFIDLSYGYLCDDPRRSALIAKSDPTA